MIHLKNLQTNEIIEFQNENAIGVQFQDITKYILATPSEIESWQINKLKTQKISETKIEETRRKLLVSDQEGINIEMAGLHAIQCSELQSIAETGTKRLLTQNEIDYITQCARVQYQINLIRTKSTSLQLQIIDMTLNELENLDVTNEQYWI